MSRDVFVKFYSGKDFIKEIDFNMLKNLSARDIEGIKAVDVNAGKYSEIDYLGCIHKSKFIEEEDIITYEEDKIVLVSSAEEKYRNKLAHPTSNLDEYFTLYINREKEYRGVWYDSNSFAREEEKLRVEYNSLTEKLFRLQNIVHSVDYYKLTYEQKEDLVEEITNVKESITDTEYMIRACTSMQDLIEIFGDSVFIYYC